MFGMLESPASVYTPVVATSLEFGGISPRSLPGGV